MDAAELARALHEAAADVEPRPGFTTEVIRGGRRRRARNRLMIATSAATVTAIAATSTYVLWPDARPATTVGTATDERLTQPEQGDLSADQKFLSEAVKAWEAGLPKSWNADRGIFDDRRGAPKVYWAGNTPAGPTAVILQEAFLHPHGNLSDGDANKTQTLVGLVAKDPADGMLKLVYDQYTAKGSITAGHFMFGPGDRTLLTIDLGTPLWWSPAPQVAPTGKATRDWQPLPFTNGVAVVQVPDGVDPADVRVLARTQKPAPDDKDYNGLIYLEPSSRYVEFAKTSKFPTDYPGGGADHRLQWFSEATWKMPVGAQVTGLPDDIEVAYTTALEKGGMTDLGANPVGHGMWHVIAGLADGRSAVVSEYQEGTKPSRIFTVLFKADGSVVRVIPGDTADKAATLPVKVHLPDGQGWVVADVGATLQYRTSADGQWQDAGKNSALLPDNALQVQVTKTGAPVVVDLPR